MPDAAPIPLWRHPDLRLADKAANAVLGCLGWPFPDNPTAAATPGDQH